MLGGGVPDYLTLCAKLQWRDPTEEDLAKLPDGHQSIDSVADLPNGQIPLIIVSATDGFPEFNGDEQAILRADFVGNVTYDGLTGTYTAATSSGLILIDIDRTLMFQPHVVDPT